MKQIVTITGENLNIVTKNVEATAATQKTKAQMRLEALKAAGVDTSKYFPLGDDQLIKIENGAAVPVDMDDATIDAVGKQIVEGGYVSNWKLFRRWVMSQMFHMLRDMEKDGKSFNEVLQKKGYEYQWRMLENELYAQMKMCDHKDYENVKARNRWFNGVVAHDMAIDYISKLRSYIDDKCIYTVIQDKWYLDKMCEVARKHKDTKFLAFTKMFDVCNEYLDEGNVIPENMHILFSG